LVVMPTRLPRASNKPPPEEPGEMGAVVCTKRAPARPVRNRSERPQHGLFA
jgi:hypothetical protein